jgi:membrane associated rhomboid family serine protease
MLDLWQSALGREYPLTKLYVGLCLIVYVLMTLGGGKLTILGGGSVAEAVRWGALITGISLQEPWRVLSAMFVHFGVLHIGFNMMALWDVGRAIEQRLGSARFVLVFIGTGIIGFVASEFWYVMQRELVPTAGASGGLFGLISAFIGYLYAARDPAWKQFLVRVLIYAAIFAVALPVNNAAHFGGFIAGFPMGYLFYKEKRPWDRRWIFGGLAALLVIASFGSIVLCHLSPFWKELKAYERARESG